MPGTWRTPLTWTIGMVTDTMMNQHVRDQLSALKNDHWICCGRLTLTPGVAVTVTDVTAATTLYFTPFRGNLIALHDGDHWQVRAFAELSLVLGGIDANTNWDVFAALTATGAITLEGVAWTGSTTRAVALTTLDGVLVKSSDTTRRYLGTFRTTAVPGQIEDSVTKRYLWNYYNRVPRRLRVVEATASWTYTTPTTRQANNSASNQVALVTGVAENHLELTVQALASNTSAGVTVAVAIGEDSLTTGVTGMVRNVATTAVAPATSAPRAEIRRVPSIGHHIYAWLEYSSAVGTTTWYGQALETGMLGSVEG